MYILINSGHRYSRPSYQAVRWIMTLSKYTNDLRNTFSVTTLSYHPLSERFNLFHTRFQWKPTITVVMTLQHLELLSLVLVVGKTLSSLLLCVGQPLKQAFSAPALRYYGTLSLWHFL